MLELHELTCVGHIINIKELYRYLGKILVTFSEIVTQEGLYFL